MKTAERIVMVALLLVLVGGAAWIYFTVEYKHNELVAAVARGEYEQSLEQETKEVPPEDWQSIYPSTVPIYIGDTLVQASVADTISKRIKGLSDTPFLPAEVVKLFVFGAPGNHSIWMKDMNYALDILWVAEEGEVVHIETGVSPDSYPASFASPVPAWYVIEASAGFVASNTIAVGDQVVLPLQ